MKILFLSRWFPYPVDNGAKLRIYHLLHGLAQVHEVHLVSFADNPATAARTEIETFCRSVRVAAWKEYQPNSLKSLVGLFNPEPRSLADIYSPEMEAHIRQALAGQRFDLVILSEWQMTAYRRLFSHLPILYEEIEVGLPYAQYINASSTAARLRAGLTWFKQRRYLRGLLTGGQACTVVSEEERRLLHKVVPGATDIFVIPNGVNIEEYTALNETLQPNSLIFTGSFRYRPNHQAMVWFIEQILPRIREQIPEVALTITGDNAGLSLPACENVTTTGFVDDVRPLVARSWASIVPLLEGGGTRLKILEAMAMRTPVIATTKGAQGIDYQENKHLLIADSPEGFAAKVVRLLKDSRLRADLSVNALQLAREKYDWKVIMPDFLDIVSYAASR